MIQLYIGIRLGVALMTSWS